MQTLPWIGLAVLVFTHAAAAQRVAPGTPKTTAAPDPKSDPTLGAEGLPFYVSLMPKPAPEPWRYPDGETRRQRYVSETFGMNTYAGAAVAAAYSFWLNDPREWDQDAGGYGLRVANNVAGAWVRGTAVHGLAVVFKEDIGYSRSNKTGTKDRIFYAISRSMLAKNGNGNLRFSYARAAGGVGSAFLSRTWAPESWRSWDNAGKNYGYWLATEAGFNVAKEFFPSMVRALRNKKNRDKQ